MKYLGKITDNKDLVTKEYVDNADSNKVDKVSGKGLSTNDYTTAEKNKLAGIAAGAQVNSVTGVKGDNESSYRTGNVNLTAANIGAAASSHTHSANDITSVRESEITWGNKDFRAGYSVGDVFLNDYLRANRFSGLRAEGITIEHSHNNGETWTAYETTDLAKRNLFTINGDYRISGSTTTLATASDQLRITVDTGLGGIYSYLNKFHIYVSTNGSNNCTVSIDAAPSNDIDNFNTNICTDVGIAGWSGWNVIHIPFSFCTAYTSQSTSTNYRKIRFLFKHSGITGTTYNGLQVLRIFAFGGVGYSTPSSMALTGHAYTFNGNMDVTFPAVVTATGGLSNTPIYFNSTSCPAFSSNPDYILGIESFASGGQLKYIARSNFTASRSTGDKNGNDITSTYTPLSSGFGRELASISVSDWNAVTGTKCFYATSTANAKPAGTDHVGLQLAYSSSWKYQFAFDYRTDTIYTRACQSGTWHDWYPIYTTAKTIDADTVNGHTVEKDVPADAVFTDTTYESKSASSGGTAVSLVTTGEKYTWNNKSTVPTNHASTATTYGTGSSSNYGHVKLSASTSSTSAESGGIAATPSAVKSAYDLANTANSTANTALSGVNGGLIYDHTFTISNGVATFTPHVYKAGAEVTTDYAVSCFTWKYRLIDGSEVTLTTKSDRGCDVTISNMGYGGHVIGLFTPA